MRAFVRLAAIAVSVPLLSAISACGGGGGGASTNTPATPLPSISVSVKQSAPHFEGDVVSLEWSSSNASSCSFENTALTLPSGTLNVTLKDGSNELKVQCTGSGGTNTGQFPITATKLVSSFSSIVEQRSLDVLTVGYEKLNDTVTLSPYQFNTGVWGIRSADSYYVKQEGSVNNKLKTFSMNVDWTIASSATPGVVTFTNATFGKNPLVSNGSNDGFLPKQLSSLNSFPMKGQVSTVCLTVCRYNTMLGVYVMNTGTPTNTDKGVEIIIVLNYNVDDISFVAPNAPTVNIGGHMFRVFQSSFDAGWSSVVYVPYISDQIENVDFNINDFLKDSVTRGYMNINQHVVSVELGTEVTFGTGKTLVKDTKIGL